jgi:hypothetical protein
MIKNKLLRILNLIQFKNDEKLIIEINDQKIIKQIDEILGENKFIYYRRPNEINLCLIYKKKNIYTVKLYWIKELLNNEKL